MSAPKQSSEENGEEVGRKEDNDKFRREEIKDAIAKAVELRALHAALVQGGGSPGAAANLRFSLASPVSSHHLHPHFSALDYPVFTPSYEDEPLPGYKQLESRSCAETPDEYNLRGTESGNESVLSDNNNYYCPKPKPSLRKMATTPFVNMGDSPQSFLTDQTSLPPRASPAGNHVMPPQSDSHSSAQSQQPKNKGLMFSWLFPRVKKKSKSEFSPMRTESEGVSQIYTNDNDIGFASIEALKKQLKEANESRDAALREVAETKSSIAELSGKLEYLERNCEELKNALIVAAKDHSQLGSMKLKSLPRIVDGGGKSMPVSEEVMLEGFLQVASEARLSVKQFCKTLISRIEEADGSNLSDNLNLLLQPYRLTLNSKYSKAVLYHLEAIINQTLYQDFENCAFVKNGSPKHLNPDDERQSQFSSFVALRDLSWNQVLKKGTKYYSEEFSKFCDQRMSFVITALNWNTTWPEQLLQAFFVSAKCIWLLHLLAFSFSPPLVILRVEENRPFEAPFMEDVFADRQRSQGPGRVKVMVMPGFYVQDRVLRCKVICRYKSAT
ncbi:unnamed protein product [Cuscuta epithymum]|uniref:IRK-interacting protein n=1 Tax=Cuscuta epithymum TaxID=186058 RepID=A0AAV0G3G1_9ASTE|nr:unnamed protein product [Cuscuta epithymum]CAH9142490.1 unnamed protein product [Cuscuta epithymum]